MVKRILKILSFLTAVASLFASVSAVYGGGLLDLFFGISSETKKEISRRIFEEDFNGLYIDLRDLGIPDTEQNRESVTEMFEGGFPVFRYNGSFNYDEDGFLFVFENNTPGYVLECQAVADRLLSGIAGNDSYTEAQKAYLIMLALSENCRYYYSDAEQDPLLLEDGHVVYDALVRGKAVCEGFARSYTYLCRRAGLDCYYQQGIDPDSGLGHAWNMIYLTDSSGKRRPYFADPTWICGATDGTPDFDEYFLKSYSVFNETHYPYDLPYYPDAEVDMAREEYEAEPPSVRPPKISIAYGRMNEVDLVISTESETISYYFGTEEDPSDDDFTTLTKSEYSKLLVLYGSAREQRRYFAVLRDGTGEARDSIDISETVDYDLSTEELTVFAVDPDAPYHRWNNRISFDRVTVSDGIEVIPENAFRSYTAKSFVLPDSVTLIGAGAFRRCRNLEQIELPKNLEEIGKRAFSDCGFLESVKFNSIPRVAPGAFAGCDNLKNVFVSTDGAITLCFAVNEQTMGG